MLTFILNALFKMKHSFRNGEWGKTGHNDVFHMAIITNNVTIFKESVKFMILVLLDITSTNRISTLGLNSTRWQSN